MAHSVVETQIIEAYKVNTSRRTTIIHIIVLSTLKSLNVDEEDGNEDTINNKTKNKVIWSQIKKGKEA